MKSVLASSGASDSGMRARSSAIATPSRNRSLRRSNTSAPGTIPKASASSIVAGRVSADSSREVGVNPCARAISLKLISSFGGSPTGAAVLTNEPRPTPETISPSSARRRNARRTVTRLTPSCSHSARSAGIRSPGASSPLSMASAITRYTRS